MNYVVQLCHRAKDAKPTSGTWSKDWKDQLRQCVTTLAELEGLLSLSNEERLGVKRALAAGLPLSVTPYYISLCDPLDSSCPIRRQCIPLLRENEEVIGDLRDPLGEEVNEVAPHLIQRYPDRALLIATDRCGVYCRFCTRSRIVGQDGGVRDLGKLEPAFHYLQSHPKIEELIISGGDPLIMSNQRLAALLFRVSKISSLHVVRIASRVPVTLPQRIDAELCQVLRSHPSLWFMTHFNHPKELTAQAERACTQLVDAGIPVMNQTVLLRGINDQARILEQLFRGLVRWRVRPYYLLQMDPVRGSAHLRTPLRRGIEIMERLQGNLSGIALPKLIVDTPGGKGKVPLLPDYYLGSAEGRNQLRTFRGEIVEYIDPPQ